ncbi:MAG: PsiF family protein, partial [Gammaproteobacteria bacterium]
DNMNTRTPVNGRHLLLLIATLATASAPLTAAEASTYIRNDCNAQANSLTGEARRQAIAACVRKKSQSDNLPPMLAKVSECNRKAGDMSGDARSHFMDNCLKNN